MDFDYSCFGRAFNYIIMNCVMNCKLCKTWDCLDKLRNHYHLGKYCVLDVFSVMISSVLFFSDVHFFQLHTAFKLVSEIVQCCPPQSEVI